jgi:hypothetical protein
MLARKGLIPLLKKKVHRHPGKISTMPGFVQAVQNKSIASAPEIRLPNKKKSGGGHVVYPPPPQPQTTTKPKTPAKPGQTASSGAPESSNRFVQLPGRVALPDASEVYNSSANASQGWPSDEGEM